MNIKKAAVLGSGVMGSGIAAHLANVGIPTLLLDVVPTLLTADEEKKQLTLEDRQVRNRLSTTALAKLTKQKPAPLTSKSSLSLITPGNLEDHLQQLSDCDWIIEVVVERLDIKQQLFERIDSVRKKGSIVSSNTSGISIHEMAKGRSEDFKAHFLGTHFFNPPRYLKLLEIIPTHDTKSEIVEYVKTFGEDVLGKGVVIAKDTPNFIANRIGTYGLLVTVQEMLKGNYSVGEVDSVTGPLIGRPKSATFRTLDVVGLDTFIHVANNVFDKVEGKEKEVFDVPLFMKQMQENGFTSFYKEMEGQTLYYEDDEYKAVKENKKVIHLSSLRSQNNVILENSGASLIDLGDDVACLQFTSPNNAIGLDIISLLNQSLEEVNKNYKGLVIGNQGKNFCVGANLAMILMEAQDDNYFEIEFVIKQFQQAMMKVKYNEKPVVAAPFAMTLGGGAEICLPSAKIQASAETYMGLVEVGVGLIPGGGGNKELYIKQLNGLPNGVTLDLQQIANKTFETIATAKVSTSAAEARQLNFLNRHDGISVNGDHLLNDAKNSILALHDTGYKPPVRTKIPVVGETGYATLLLGAQSMKYSGYISEHDYKIASKLAFVLAGGRVAFGSEVDEEYLLDLEREAFLSLVGEAKSQERMQHMLVKGKPLRN
ncbi:3-hydroxyacyl-CoA dehydrogenase/enoyl-CoA hydratase family protein [Priestia megaterium]|uniref:3-hydroxyacyl-CoA dehydrogenase/enoyl-CoA hydratase family protein n=1 Tax=Priestia megaterium TaxID=1404 RepID=UPI002FFFB5C7